MEEKKDWEQRIVDYSADLMDKHFPKGECKERGKALVFNAKLITYVMGELDRAREEGREELTKEIRESIKRNIKIDDTESKHIKIDTDIVKILNDREITKMFLDRECGGWGWYS